MTAKPNLTDFEYLILPASRFIGVDANRYFGDWGKLWARKSDYLPRLYDMRKRICPAMPHLIGLQHSANGIANVEDHLIVGKFFGADTPVPDGFDHIDFAPQRVGFALFEGVTLEHLSQMQTYIITRDKILSDGNFVPYPVGYWNAEVYFDSTPPFDGNAPTFRCGELFASINEGEAATAIVQISH